YALRLSNVAVAPMANGDDWNQSHVVDGTAKRVGPPPYGLADFVDEPALHAGVADAVVTAFLGALKTDAARSDLPLYYAEKIPLPLADIVVGLIPQTKNILLIRDPRDEFLSIRSFNEKR